MRLIGTPNTPPVDPCTCTLLAAQTPHEPSEWEQDPWCPTHPDVPFLLAEVGRLRAGRAASEARLKEALVSLSTVTDDEYATVVARHVESLLTLDLQTSDGEVQPEACPTVSGASPSEPDDPHGACSRNLVAVARERDAARARLATIAQRIDQAWAEAKDRRQKSEYREGYLDGLEHAESIARTTLANPTTTEATP